VKNLSPGDIRIIIRGHRFSVVETGKVKIHFFAKHIGYYEEPSRNYETWWGFDVEEKLFMTSDHSTKISFFAPEGKEKGRAEKITAFIDKIMAEASIKPIPRFALAKVAHSK